MFSSPFSQLQRQQPESIATAGSSSPLCSDQTVANFAMTLATVCENEHNNYIS